MPREPLYLYENRELSPYSNMLSRYPNHMSRDQLWAQIRLLRVNPPGFASKGSRRNVFGSALRQSEELFRSAELLSPATRPINIFYGLSQAARALAASGIQDSRGWQVRGHGITHDGGFERSLSSIQFTETAEPRGAYTSIADLLGSPRSSASTPLVNALAAFPLAPSGASWIDLPRPLALKHVPMGIDGVHLVMSQHFYAKTRGWPTPPHEIRANREALTAWASAYLTKYFPSLSSGSPFPDNNPRLERSDNFNVVTLKFVSEASTGSDWQRVELLKAKGIEMGGQLVRATDAPRV